MKKLKQDLFVAFVIVFVSVIFSFWLLYFLINNIFVKQEVEKARMVATTILAYRGYLSKISTHIKPFDKNVSFFACTPAKVTNEAAEIISDSREFFIRQVSDRYRNQKDKPTYYDLKAINYFKTHKNAKEFWEVYNYHSMINGNFTKRLYYAYVLRVKPSCLKCHGDPKKDVPPFIYKKLIKRYGNKAFGYKVGELRGILSIVVPISKVNKEVLLVFMISGFLLVFVLSIGIYLVYRIYKNIISDIDKILKFFKEKVSKGIYVPLLVKMHYLDFENLKIMINRTIETIKEYKKELFHKLYYNSITHIPNRNKFLEDYKKRALMLVNIDKFREINNYFGTEIADKLILEVSNRLKKLARKYKFEIYHIDIDEFALVFNDVMERGKFFFVASKILKFLEEPYIIDNNEIIVKFRIGGSIIEKDYLNAEVALNKAKEIKKDIVLGDDLDSFKKSYEDTILWLKKLKKAIKENRIEPFFQPIVDKNKRVVKYEALVRMIDEDGKVISPYFFLDIARKSMLYLDITHIMFNKVLDIVKKKGINVSINLSLEDIDDEKMREEIISKLSCFEKPQRITFEIVENEDVSKSEKVKEFLNKVKSIGCKIYIDDFGSGYSNFDYLLKLHPDGVKIDGSLIKNILEDTQSRIMIKTIVSFAKEMNIKTIAEFVESEEIFELLKSMGVDYFQGYYFSPPKPL